VNDPWDVIVVGAGAAGILAAARAAECGAKTLLLEKNRRPGVKILMSGGTRCNITHDCDRRGIVEAFGDQGPFLHSALAALGPREVVALIEAEGVATKVEEHGKIFPVSNAAADVLAALLRRLERSGAILATEEPLTGLVREGELFRLTTPQRELLARQVIVTSGGQSYPGSGTIGEGYAWAKSLGHTIVPPRPALTPITSDAAWVVELRGLTLPDVTVRIVPRAGIEIAVELSPRAGRGAKRDGTILAERRGGMLFTHFGLSGPALLDVSRAVTGHHKPQELDLACDFLPHVSLAALEEELKQSAAASGKKIVAHLMPPALPARLAEALVALSGISPERRGAEFGKAERQRLAASIKECRIPVTGTKGFGKAEVTAGGIALAEVDSKSMRSKLVPGLFFAGEVLDLDGPIGGYNFQAAFSTGWLAGQCAAEPVIWTRK